MIKSFKHKGLQKFFETGSTAGIQHKHASKLRRQLFTLNNAAGPNDMRVPGWDLHSLSHNLEDHWSVSVSGNWRLTFMFDGTDVILVNYQDYH